MRLDIYIASDAFLYLPAYIADKWGIFKTILLEYGISDVKLHPPTKSDALAIEQMLTTSYSDDMDVVSIAIADPTAFLSKTFNHKEKEHTRVIGAIIDKLPFWGVDHHDGEKLKTIGDIKTIGNFDTVIHPKSDYITGYYLGTYIKSQTGIKTDCEAEFNKEIEHLNKRKFRGKKPLAVTADIVSVVKAEERGLKINYKFSEDPRFEKHITTGVLTAQKYCDDQSYESILNGIVESFQKAISILYCSNEIAENICTELPAAKSRGIHEDKNAIEKIIDRIRKEKFYPADLDIKRECWDSAVEAISWCDMLPHEVKVTSFDMYVNNKFVHNSERRIAKEFGIDVNAYEGEIENLKSENRHLKNVWWRRLGRRLSRPLRYLFNKTRPTLKLISIFVSIILGITVLLCVGVLFEWYQWTEIRTIVGYVDTAIGSIGSLWTLIAGMIRYFSKKA